MIAPELERITDYVPHWAARRPQQEALVGSRVRLSYRALNEHVNRCALGLLARGVRHGDRVALLGVPDLDFFVNFLACASIGAIWVGLNPKYTLPELQRVVDDSKPALLFACRPGDDAGAHVLSRLSSAVGAPVVTFGGSLPGLSITYEHFLEAGSGGHEAGLAEARARVRALDPAAMIYTSGSTGVPKGALVPHGGLAYCGAVQADHWYGDRIRKLCDLPINHIGCLGDICCSVLTAGGTIVFMPGFDAVRAIEKIEMEHVTHVYWIPTQLLAVVATPAWSHCDLSSLERILWGGAAAPAGLLQALGRLGVRLGTSYSLTESTGSVTYTRDDDPLHVLEWSVGQPDSRYDVQIVDADGRPTPQGHTGEIVIRGKFITRGYFGNPRATAATIDSEGWLHTGDLASQDETGNYRLVGRLKEMFKSGGYNVYPREVEAALEQHPAVIVAAVVAVADERWGEVGHAFVAVRGSPSRGELEAFARERLANYKIPKAIHTSPSLPTLPNGKLDKRTLQLRALQSSTKASRPAHR